MLQGANSCNHRCGRGIRGGCRNAALRAQLRQLLPFQLLSWHRRLLHSANNPHTCWRRLGCTTLVLPLRLRACSRCARVKPLLCVHPFEGCQPFLPRRRIVVLFAGTHNAGHQL